MALLGRNADYTDRDMASLRARARGLIKSVFPDWTDVGVANVANLLVELNCWTGDLLAFYQDKQAAESRWTTAKQRRNLLALAKMVGFVPDGATAATANVTFTLAAAVPAGRTVTFNPPANPTPTNPLVAKTLDVDAPVTFQLTAPVVITAGNTTGTGVVENSTLEGPETFTATGLPGQVIDLGSTPYLDGSAVVTAGNGTFSEVSSLLQSGASDLAFTVSVDENDRAHLRFGDGVNGAVPVGTILVTYKTGGGSAGNVAANTIQKLSGSFVDSAGDPVTVTITNAQAAAGGAERDGVEEIREKVPVSLQALTRTVSRVDFETHAKTVPGIERALMLTTTEDGTISTNTGRLYIVPSGTGFPSTNLQNAALLAVTQTYPCTLTFTPSVLPPQYVDIGVKATIFLKPGYAAATVRANIIAALQAFFALRDADGAVNPLIDFGYYLQAVTGAPAGTIALSDLFNVVRDIDGVRAVGDNTTDFQVNAYRVISTTDSYTGGSTPATLVQAFAHTSVPVSIKDFPRLKATTFGGAIPDVDLTIDTVHYAPGP